MASLLPHPNIGAVLIPARNEVDTVGDVVRGARQATGWEVVVIDDASADATASRAREVGARVLPLPVHLGAWGATQTGIRYALRQGYEMAVTMDGDGQHLAHELRSLLAPVESGEADVSIGAHVGRGSPGRQLAWRFFRTLTGLGVDDLTSGFRAYNRPALEVLGSRDATLLDYQDIGVLNLAREAGLRVAEVEVAMNPRIVGKSRVFSSWFAVGAYLLKTLFLCLSKWEGPWLRRPSDTRTC